MARRTATGAGIQNIQQNQLNPGGRNPGRLNTRLASGRATNFQEYMEASDEEDEAREVMKYGGTGAFRKVLFGFTSGMLGEDNAKNIAMKYGNRKQQEKAFQTLYGQRGNSRNASQQNQNSQQTSSNTNNQTQQTQQNSQAPNSQQNTAGQQPEALTKEQLEKVTKRITSRLDRISSKINDVITVANEIKTSTTKIDRLISPRDITIGDEENKQVFTYDPLAPEGKQVRVKGAGARFASKKGGVASDYERVINRATYANLSPDSTNFVTGAATNTTPKPTAERVDGINAKKLVKILKDEILKPIKKEFENLKRREKRRERGRTSNTEIQSTRTSQRIEQEEDTGPKNFEEYYERKKKIDYAQEVMKYGGTGFGKKTLFGFTSGLLGEENAKNIAMKFGNRKQQEEAFQILKSGGRFTSAQEASNTATQTTSTLTANGTVQAAQAMEALQTRPTNDDNDTETQNEAENAEAERRLREAAEAEEEWKKNVTEKLDEIKKLLEKAGDGGGGGGGIPGGGALMGLLRNPFVLGGIAAGLGGLGVGKLITDNTQIDEGIGSGLFSMFGPSDEARQNSQQQMDQMYSQQLAGTGYKPVVVEEGGELVTKFQGPNGETVSSLTDLPEEAKARRKQNIAAQNSTANTTPTSSATEPTPEPTPTPQPTATPATPAPAKNETAVNEAVQENVELKQNEEPKIAVVSQPTPAPQPVVMQGQQQGNAILFTKNEEPSISTYVASIFDHPVVHPGIYKM